MRTSYVVIVSIVIGGALGAGMTWANFRNSPPLIVDPPAIGPDPVAVDGQPKVLVDSRFHDFGAVEHDSKQVHVFKITNLGDAPLSLEAGGTSCTRCTITKLQKTRLEPGESTGVTLEYHPKASRVTFRENAAIITNDPDQAVVELTIVGTVTSRFSVVPQHLVLSKISTKVAKKADIKIYDFVSDDISVEEFEFTGARSAEYFEAAVAPIPPDQLAEPGARSGCRVTVTIKPGLPVGPVRQTIRLRLKMAGSPTNPIVEVPIEGTVDADISIVGRDWNSKAGRLRIGAVDRSEGAKRTLFVMLRGPHRRDTIIKAAKIDPRWMKVSLGEARELSTGAGADGGVSQIPLTIEIPPGSPLVNRLGSDQGSYAEVILETTNPDVKQIRMYVQFVILP